MTPRRFSWIAAAVFWVVFGLISGIQVWISMITHGHSVPLLLGYHILVWGAWFGVTAAVVWLNHRFPVIPARRFHVLIHSFAACLFAVAHGLYWLGLLIWMRPFDVMTAEPSELEIASILFYRLPLELLLYMLVLGGALAFDYYEKYRERALEAARLQSSLVDARLHALELQIQPHFLFNTLNAITALVRTKRNEEAVKMMTGLSEILRYTLDHEGRQFVSLETELSVVRRFLEIQQARFPDRMSFVITAQPGTLQAAVPTFILQPLAENAVRHGLEVSAGSGSVEVRASRSGDRLEIRVLNTGAIDEGAPRGIGLRNTVERLQHLYGSDWSFGIVNTDGAVVASLILPWSETS